LKLYITETHKDPANTLRLMATQNPAGTEIVYALGDQFRDGELDPAFRMARQLACAGTVRLHRKGNECLAIVR